MENQYYTMEEIQAACLIEAAKSPCNKRKVGAILTYKNYETDSKYKILSQGHNHNIKGHDKPCECSDGNTLEDVVHAEVNAINKALELLDGHGFGLTEYGFLTMFVTHEPCNGCKATMLKYNINYAVVGKFMKFDSGKPRMNLVPASLALGCAKVLTYGAKKYKVNNWRQTPDIECYINALQRHFDAWREGEDNDKESGLSHLDHVAANLAFLIELKDLPKIKQ